MGNIKHEYDHYDDETVLSYMDGKCVCKSRGYDGSNKYDSDLEAWMCRRCQKEICVDYTVGDLFSLAGKIWPVDEDRVMILIAAIKKTKGRRDDLFDELKRLILLKKPSCKCR